MNKKNAIAKINIEMIEKTEESHFCNLEVFGTGADLLQLFGDIAEHLMIECGVPKEFLHEIISTSGEKGSKKEEGDEIPEEVKAKLAFLRRLGIL